MKEVTCCIVCGREDIREKVTTTDLLLGRPDVQAKFVECKHCGLVFQNPHPEQNELGEHYPKNYQDFFDTPHEEKNLNNRGARRQISYINRFISHGKLLDIGSGMGGFLAALQYTGNWEVTGLEPDPTAAGAARDRYMLSIIENTLEGAELTAESFDAVTLWDVLEHLPDPAAALEKIHHVIRPGGWMFIRVPNVCGWEAALFGPSWSGWDAPRHISAFSPEALELALRQAGLTPRQIFGGAEDFSSFAISVEFWDRARNGGRARTTWVTQAVRSGLVRAMGYPFFWLSGHTRARSRITMVAQRPRQTNMPEAA